MLLFEHLNISFIQHHSLQKWEVNAMKHRVRFHKTSNNERLWYMHMWMGGWSIRSIAQRTDRSPTTVRRWLRRLLQKHRLPTHEYWMHVFLYSMLIMKVNIFQGRVLLFWKEHANEIRCYGLSMDLSLIWSFIPLVSKLNKLIPLMI